MVVSLLYVYRTFTYWPCSSPFGHISVRLEPSPVGRPRRPGPSGRCTPATPGRCRFTVGRERRTAMDRTNGRRRWRHVAVVLALATVVSEALMLRHRGYGVAGDAVVRCRAGTPLHHAVDPGGVGDVAPTGLLALPVLPRRPPLVARDPGARRRTRSRRPSSGPGGARPPPAVIHDPRRTPPEGWRAVASRRFGPFTTELTLVGRDGSGPCGTPATIASGPGRRPAGRPGGRHAPWVGGWASCSP